MFPARIDSGLRDTLRFLGPEMPSFARRLAMDSAHYSELCQDIYRFIPAQLTERDTQRFYGIDERIAIQHYVGIVSFFYQLIKDSAGGDFSRTVPN